MSIEVEVLVEAYTILAQYIPTKDKQEAADHLMSTLVDLISDEELKELSGLDAYSKRAYKEYSAPEDDVDFEDDDR